MAYRTPLQNNPAQGIENATKWAALIILAALLAAALFWITPVQGGRDAPLDPQVSYSPAG